jgi:CheY-like chemotaxis protein
MNGNSEILIVEDNPRNLKLVRDVLEHHGYPTVAAGSAEEGIEVARSRHPALILMDVQLPGIDGVEALERLRQDAATADICVVALTAFAMRDDRERFLAAGFDAYLEKPLDVPSLAAQIAALIDGDQREARR